VKSAVEVAFAIFSYENSQEIIHFLLFHLLLNFAGVVPHDRRPSSQESATRHWHSV
jgi:hypothetical protein